MRRSPVRLFHLSRLIRLTRGHRGVLVALLALTAACGPLLRAQATGVTNPIAQATDPYIYTENGTYHLLSTATGADGKEITIKSSGSLATLGSSAETTVWTDPNTFESPELYHSNGLWYIFYTSYPDNTGKVLESDGDDPLGTYHKGNDDLCDNCYDLSLMYTNNQLYLIYSNFTQIAIRPMADYKTPSGYGTGILFKTQDWEGDCCIEAPNATYDPATGRIYIIYSGNHYDSPNYGLGAAGLALGSDPTNPDNWTKVQGPIFGGTDTDKGIYGAGTFSAFTSKDGTQNWFSYNSYLSDDYTGLRYTRVQPFTFDSNGLPQLGTMDSSSVVEPLPSGDSGQ